MPSWLLILLTFLVNGLLAFCLQRWAYHRGYDAGIEDAQVFGRYLDDIRKEARDG
ncbi:hypothetical protein [Hymenobacter sp.]|uniref:hypothetical protein n=1 Tax=Hymenobacter sp. TaxID=1898978 RepID=UPI00286B0029|nr:hypothetical protein [Hymenobacter sp.]